MNKSSSIVNLAKALIAVKKELEPIVRDSDNPFFKSKYADLAAVIENTDPILSKNGLVISQFPCSNGTSIGVQTILLHESGEFLEDSFTLPIAKQDAQTGTAAVTYARRTALKAVLGVAEVDDDGNTAAGRNEKTETKVVSQPKEVSKPKPAPKADVVKAAIPNAPAQTPQTGSNTSTVSTSDPSIPSAEELNIYRVKFGTLVTGLSSSGLAPRKGFPVQKQVLAYLLKFAGKEKTELITKELWDKFFVYCDSIPSEDLVKYVNQVFEGEQEVAKKS